jgi:hypothetical protein
MWSAAMKNMTSSMKQPVVPAAPTPSAQQGNPASVKQVPKWLTFGVVSAFVIGSGALIVKQFYTQPDTGDEIDLKDGDYAPRSPAALARHFAPPPEGVRYNKNHDGAIVRAGDVEMRVSMPAPKHEATDFSIYYARNSYMTKQQNQVLAAAQRLVRDASAAQYVGVSKDQRKALKEIGWPTMKVSDGDRDRAKKLWADYAAAKGDVAQLNAQDALVAALKSIGEANAQATEAIVVERCKKVTSILSAGQLDKFNSMGQANAAPKKENIAKADAPKN